MGFQDHSVGVARIEAKEADGENCEPDGESWEIIQCFRIGQVKMQGSHDSTMSVMSGGKPAEKNGSCA